MVLIIFFFNFFKQILIGTDEERGVLAWNQKMTATKTTMAPLLTELTTFQQEGVWSKGLLIFFQYFQMLTVSSIGVATCKIYKNFETLYLLIFFKLQMRQRNRGNPPPPSKKKLGIAPQESCICYLHRLKANHKILAFSTS